MAPEKVSEIVSEKFDTGTDFCRQNLGILKIYYNLLVLVLYRHRDRNVSFILVVSELVSKKFGKSLVTGIGKIWYRKKVLEPVSEKFGTDKKVLVSVLKIFGTGKKYRYWYRSTFWVPSHTDSQ